MKKIYLLLITLFLNGYSFSQNLKKVDQIVYSYNNVNSIEKLTTKINYDFKTKIEKVRALYTWITSNIQYQFNTNSKTLKAPNHIVYYNEYDLLRRLKLIDEKIIKETMTTKIGVCNNIALILKKGCDLLKIESELIKGYVKSDSNDIGYIPNNKNHIWNTVNINGKWILIDATFGISFNTKILKQRPNFKYFNISNELLKLTHYPSEQKWKDFFNHTSLLFFCNSPLIQSAFLTNGIEIISPRIGKVDFPKQKLQITLKNLNPSTKVTYKYKNDNYAKKPIIQVNYPYTNITITKKRKGILTLYFDNESALTYIISNK